MQVGCAGSLITLSHSARTAGVMIYALCGTLSRFWAVRERMSWKRENASCSRNLIKIRALWCWRAYVRRKQLAWISENLQLVIRVERSNLIIDVQVTGADFEDYSTCFSNLMARQSQKSEKRSNLPSFQWWKSSGKSNFLWQWNN